MKMECLISELCVQIKQKALNRFISVRIAFMRYNMYIYIYTLLYALYIYVNDYFNRSKTRLYIFALRNYI